jgi:hypothetical protein
LGAEFDSAWKHTDLKGSLETKIPQINQNSKEKNAQIQVVQFAPTSAEILTWAHNLGPFTSRSASGVSDRSTSQSGILSTAWFCDTSAAGNALWTRHLSSYQVGGPSYQSKSQASPASHIISPHVLLQNGWPVHTD